MQEIVWKPTRVEANLCPPLNGKDRAKPNNTIPSLIERLARCRASEPKSQGLPVCVEPTPATSSVAVLIFTAR